MKTDKIVARPEKDAEHKFLSSFRSEASYDFFLYISEPLPHVVSSCLKVRCFMQDRSGKPARGWQEIADEAAKETNREKLDELSDELTRSLEERREYLQQLARERSAPGEKSP